MTARARDAGYDAAIIGAGPAGSAAAILLARAGWSVALVEKQRFPRRKVCGECIAASNLPLLDGLGLGAAMDRDAGPELRCVALMRGDAVALAAMPTADARHPWGRALGRETLDVLLLDAARRAGATILQPCTVTAIAGGPGNWQLSARSAEGPLTVQSSIAIAAHGSWEALPSGRARRRQSRTGADLFAFKANFRGAKLVPGCLPVLALDGGYGGMVVAEGGVLTLACCVRRDRLDALRAQAPGQRAGEAVENWLRRQCDGVDRALAGAQRDGAWLASGPIDPGVRVRPNDRLLRIGNAAGEAHPILGEGISMALQSAGLLCEQLLGGVTADQRADTAWQAAIARQYAVRWRSQFAPRLRLGALVAHLAMRPASARAIMLLARAWPGMLTWSARMGGKVRCAPDPALYGWVGRAP